MDNPFKKIHHPPKEVPKELKKKIMQDIAALLLIKDMASLFLCNYAEVSKSILPKNKDK